MTARIVVISAAVTPISSDVRAPYSNRTMMSRPLPSAPRKNLPPALNHCGPTGMPEKATTLTSLLPSLMLSVRWLADASVWATSCAQIGFDDWFQDFPHPGDFIGNLLTTAAAKSLPSFNNGFVSDPHVDSQVDTLDAKPAQSVASSWAALDKYVNDPQHAYIAVYGNEEDTAFYSSRINVKDCSGYPHLAHRVDWQLLCLK